MALNVASGLGLRHHEDTVAMERFLFYTAASRPTDLLALSWHTADDDGKPTVRSFFVDDVADLLAPEAMERRSRRPLGAAGWDAAIAPTAREARLAAAAREGELAGTSEPIAELRDEEVLRSLRERPTWSASALEAWTACPVRWFVEQLLRPEGLEPDPEPLVRGTFAHEALEAVYRELPDGRLEPGGLPAARAVLHRVLGELEGRHRISVNPDRLRAEVRRLESDLVRFLEHAAHDGSTFRATDLEVRFGGAKDPLPAAALAGGALQLAGRIDRVDRNAAGEAIIRDYKGRSAVAGAARWLEKGKLQMGLYMLAAADVLDVEPVGGLYQQLGPEELKPRGLLHEDADPDLKVGRDDRMSPEEARAILDDVERAALEAVNEIRRGRLEPRPDTCGWAGNGCSYPSICRCARS
jgi:ATP-dependent helicase/DNAse subunit B